MATDRQKHRAERFKRNFQDFRRHGDFLARLLKSHGLDIVPHHRAPSKEYIHDVYNGSSRYFYCEGELLDVMGCEHPFTTVGDFKFSEPRISTVNTWTGKEKSGQIPTTVIVISNDLKGIMCLWPSETRKYWTQKYNVNRKNGPRRWTYHCPKEHWQPIEKLVEFLKSKQSS